MVNSRVWHLAKQPKGEPTPEDFVCKEVTLPPCGDGDVILEAECLSVDPYMRFQLPSLSPEDAIMGEQVARVIESKNVEWPVGSRVTVQSGWRSHTHLTSDALSDPATDIHLLPPLGNLPATLCLGTLGMPGKTAYLAMMEVVRPKAGETVLVNAAAGAVGSLVVQLAKIAGCKVIACASSGDKLSWIKQLGADHTFNYKTEKVGEVLAEVAPEGINIFFDSVGGTFSSEALPHMAARGRVLVCGNISGYNDEGNMMAPTMRSPLSTSIILIKELTVQGFLIFNWRERWSHAFMQMKKLLDENKIQYRETVQRGFDKMPTAFIGLFQGTNTGKVVVTA